MVQPMSVTCPKFYPYLKFLGHHARCQKRLMVVDPDWMLGIQQPALSLSIWSGFTRNGPGWAAALFHALSHDLSHTQLMAVRTDTESATADALPKHRHISNTFAATSTNSVLWALLWGNATPFQLDPLQCPRSCRNQHTVSYWALSPDTYFICAELCILALLSKTIILLKDP